MKAKLSILAIVLSLVFVGSVFGLLEDFNDGKADGWEEIQGDWSVVGGKYLQEDTEWTTTATHETYHRSFFGDVGWEDYTIEAEVTIVEDGELAPIAGIFFRVTDLGDMGDYYYWRIDQRPATGPMLIKSPNTIIAQDPGAFPDAPTETGKVAVMKAVVTGGHFECWLDGNLLFEVDDPDFKFGAIGVGTFNAAAEFDNITVEGPGVPATAVEFTGKLSTTWADIKHQRIRIQ